METLTDKWVYWESQSIDKPNMTAYLDVLWESCQEVAHASQLVCSPDKGELLRAESAVITLDTMMGPNVINPSDMSGSGMLSLPHDHKLLIALVAISNSFHQTFRLENEPQIQFSYDDNEQLPDAKRCWIEVAELLRLGDVSDTLIDEYRYGLAIQLGLAGEPLDIRSSRIPDAFF
ncbi:hypothetical protein [Vreelandella massiliensis]|uniref:hypothetical protein n=1 Tax=Vreelandella massiliensis TaxID=1816686 RepID=UPI00096AA919|nr:hypothetical protein [Halomonas massiliensis]